MVYDDNEAVLQELESLSGTEVERYPGNEIAVPEDKRLENPPVV